MQVKRVLLSCALTLSVAVSPGVLLTAADSRAARTAITIDNFGEVSPTYFRGAQPEGRDYATLASLGIKTVIDLRKDFEADEEGLVEAAGMKFVRIPMTTRVAPTAAQIDSFLTLVNDPANQPVFVHCVGGKHRTGVMTAVYRMVQDGWTSDQAFKEMKRYKFGMDFLHPEFKRFVYAFRAEPAAPAAPATGVIATTIN
jgi:protein tyrosine/serine phosphatase